ncbi:MAG: phosphoglycerate kinase [Chloroflexi bacterium]|nr:phosphoglycerate kinase [Chloroflexota bacterium]
MPRVCTVRDVDWGGKTALVRVDFNVPMEADGSIADDTRIRAVLPTLAYLRGQGAKVVLMSHFGRPRGGPEPKYSLAPVAERLSALLGDSVQFSAGESVGEAPERRVHLLEAGQVLLLENVRFHPEEETNDSTFAQKLAKLGDVFVNDAFGAAHRAHASTEGVAKYLPAVAGLLMEKELSALGTALNNPKRPFVAIVGGAKVSSKLAVLENLIGKADSLLIGGGMANTFLKAQGREVGKSLLEADLLETARGLLERARERGVRLLIPTDVVVTTSFDDASAPVRTTGVDAVRADELIMDIGPDSLQAYEAEIARAGTVLWNGPMGVFEKPAFAAGTLGVAHALAGSHAITVVGGGESVQAVEEAGVADRLTHVSTGGGASLEFIEGKTLPGVAALKADCA